MIAGLVVFLSTVFAGQCALVAASRFGPWAPDASIAVLAFAAVLLRGHALAVAALAWGWARGLVWIEPAGGHVLAALVALAVIARWREALPASLAVRSCLCAGLAAALVVATTGVLARADLTEARSGLGLLGGALLVPAGWLLLLPLLPSRGARRRRRA